MYRVLQPDGASARQIAEIVNQAMRGKLNATTTASLRANETTTTLTWADINPGSFIGFCPLTPAAATASTSLYVSSRVRGQAILTHDAQSASAGSRDYVVLVIG